MMAQNLCSACQRILEAAYRGPVETGDPYKALDRIAQYLELTGEPSPDAIAEAVERVGVLVKTSALVDVATLAFCAAVSLSMEQQAQATALTIIRDSALLRRIGHLLAERSHHHALQAEPPTSADFYAVVDAIRDIARAH